MDGVHRWSAYKATGSAEPEVIIKNLDGMDPLLYAAKKAIGPRQLSEEETRKTARRVFQNNSGLTSSEIGKAIGRSRQAVDSYIADLRAATQMELDLKIFRMNRLGIPQDRIAIRTRCTPKDNIQPFSKNARIGKSAKYRFIERIYCSAGS